MRNTNRARRSGIIFFIALGIILIISAMVLVFAQSMRVESVAAANRVSYAQADAVELAAESWVQGTIESNPGDAMTITQTPAQGIQIGDGFFWLLSPDFTTDQDYGFGIVDESSKVNLNTASAAQLASIPNVQQDAADSIVSWRGGTDANGAQTDYYSSLGYALKGAPLETVEETLLIRSMTKQYLYGYDLNRDGVVTDLERNSGQGWSNFDGSLQGGRGCANYLTVYTLEPNTTTGGKARFNVNTGTTAALETLLETVMSTSRAETIAANVYRQKFSSMAAFYTASGMQPSEIALVVNRLTTSAAPMLPGLINVNTAPSAVLATLPGLAPADGDAIVAARAATPTTSIGWLFSGSVLPINKAIQLPGLITGTSHQYSADIVAVSGDGRSFKRVRIVVDNTVTPSTIVYRRDLSGLGWSLPTDLRDSLRAGKGVPEQWQAQSGTNSTLLNSNNSLLK